MASIADLEVDRVQSSFVADSGVGGANALVTASKAAVPGKRHVIQRAIGSYSTSAGVGTLTIKLGTTVLCVQNVVQMRDINLSDWGHINPTTNQAVSAELSGGGGANTGTVTLKGYTVDPPA